MIRTRAGLLGFLGLLLAGAGAARSTGGAPAIDVGDRRQLFLDDDWFERRENIRLASHAPTPREIVLGCDRPWENKWMHYSSVLFDEGTYRMWYRVDEGDPNDNAENRLWTCYAESRDGVRWTKPNLGLVAHDGSTDNNILGDARKDFVNVSVIVDPTQKSGSPARYKMISRVAGITGYVSADGKHWRPAEGNPFLRPEQGPFDSHNTLVWDDERRLYVIYMRGVDPSVRGSYKGGRRADRRSESSDFRRWSKPELVLTADADDPAGLHFYTNAAVKYFRAAGAFLMFPMILYPERSYPGAPFPGLSDVQFAWSRDGVRWRRQFRTPFVAAGLDERNWVDRNPIMGQGVVPTGGAEISMYYSELFRTAKETRLRRCSLRTDGFVSVQGPYAGWGEFTTRPLRFEGRRLELNYRTSGGGSLSVELQDEAGAPLPGRRLEDCPEFYGDKIEGIVRWRGGADLSAHAGRPVRLRIRLRDAEVFAFRFAR